MNAARRDKRRRDWPRGLYEPRPGYYVYRSPDGKTFALGCVDFAFARAEAISVNAHFSGEAPRLLARVTGEDHTIADVLDEMPAAEKANTAKTWRTLDKRIREALGDVMCQDLTVAKCAKFIEAVVKDERKARTAEALRSRLYAVCQRGQQLGWLSSNPVEPTAKPDVNVQRRRLTLETFNAILARADEVNEWLRQAMMLAIVTGADRSTLVKIERGHAAGGVLTVSRIKTGARVAIPTSIRLEAVDASLADLLVSRTSVLSRHVLHHVRPWKNAPKGSPIAPNLMSKAFKAARDLAFPEWSDDKTAPTFHEIRSLSKRLYKAQGNVDTKALLGHSTERMSDLYEDPRGAEAIAVRVTPASEQIVNNK